MGGRQKNVLGQKPGWDAVLAFLVPALLLLLAYIRLGVYPFGEKSLLLVDMHNEYIDYFAYMNRTVRGDGSFLRSWEMGMGLNMVGLIAFYAASGLNILLLLAPVGWLTEAVLALTLLKVGLCGLTFRWYARGVFQNGVPVWAVLAASVAYALCGYNLAYSSNIMWLDGVAMLPLVLLGVERLLREGKARFLAGCLIYTFLSSYYIGYMVGVFSFLYFTVRYFSEEKSLVEYFCKLKWFMGAAVLAAACCAFLLLPAFMELRDGQAELWQVNLSPQVLFPPARLGWKLLPGSYDSLTNAGLPNLYATVAGVFGAGLFFGAKGIGRREKALMGGALGFLVVSLCVNPLDLAWHAFEDPTWFPARYSFVFSFLVLHLALRGLQAGGCPSRWTVGCTGLAMLLLFWEAASYPGTAASWVVFFGAGLVAVYMVLAVLYGRGRKRLATGLALLLVLVECGVHATAMVQGMEEEFGYKTRESYVAYRQAYLPAVEWVEHHDEGVSRMEVVQQRNANGGMGLGYRGISHYSTTTDQRLNRWLKGMGYNTGTINELRFAANNPATNGLLGIRYLASDVPVGEGYVLAYTTGNVDVYRNVLAFPLVFGADGDALAWAGDTADPFRYQNGLLGALDGGGEAAVFAGMPDVEVGLVHMAASAQGEKVVYTLESRSEPGTITYTISNPTGQPVYAYLPVEGRRFARATAYVNGEKVGRELSYRANTVLALGAGETAELRLVVESGTVRLRGAYFYRLDLEAAAEAAGRAEGMGMAFARFDDTYVSGSITAPEGGGAMVTTFPYDRGWRVWVDGKRVDTELFAGVFLAARLEGGSHQVVMRYTPPGFLAGCFISMAVVGGWLLVAWYRRRQARKGRLRD